MKDKEPSSIKAVSQASRPYPTTPRPNPQPPRSGPKYFPPEALQEDVDLEQAMDLIPYKPDPPSPPSPPSPHSPPDTPTPTPQGNRVHPLQPDLLIYQDFKVTMSHVDDDKPPSSDLASSIHAPNNSKGDHQMSAPPSPKARHEPTAEEQAILDHLALADANRSVLSQNGLNTRTTLPQFTPTPSGGFPVVHMSHSAQIFDHLDNRVLLAWFQVEHPKFLVRVFDHTGKDVAERAAILAERIRATIATIAEFVQQDPPQPQGGREAKLLPTGFLVHKVTEETKNLILSQRIWSNMDLTFEALPFNCNHPPELLFCLSGYTTLDTQTILQTVRDTWSCEENHTRIEGFFSHCGLPEGVPTYMVTHDFIESARVELLDFKITGGLSVPRFNVLATSPTNDTKTWTNLRSFLSTLNYPTSLDGCGTSTALSACQICHSLAHPRGLCPFPLVTLWNGPRVGNRNTGNGQRQPGKTRGGNGRFNRNV
ncbi:hypothetical protein C8R48DRAFT_672685 [Suillus tomentosus]|nr:hypothetical protein C8R48DRAFT_672685 [Suillus tomentosus]